MRKLYPFCRLSGPANVLVMPALHSANISYKLLQRFGGGSVIGPILIGLAKPVQIVQMGATVSDLVNAAAIAEPAATIACPAAARSEERRAGKEGVSTARCRWPP